MNAFLCSYRPMNAVQSALQGLMDAGDRQSFRVALISLESELMKLPQVDQPLRHHFTDGLYGREIFNPKGSFIITKIHKEPNFSFVLRGRLRCLSEDGAEVIEAPRWFATKPGTKRVLLAEEDTVFITVHPNPTDTQDLEELERRIIAPDFESLEVMP